jgi:hypothetical protein
MVCPLLQVTLTLSSAVSLENLFVTLVAMIIKQRVAGYQFSGCQALNVEQLASNRGLRSFTREPVTGNRERFYLNAFIRG